MGKDEIEALGAMVIEVIIIENLVEAKQEHLLVWSVLANYKLGLFLNNFSKKTIYELEKENAKFKNGIVKCLYENAHLADGEQCTLKILKDLVPEWEQSK